ncbi:MAG: hypothetical protein ACRC78_04135 [Planktothrix sp.]
MNYKVVFLPPIVQDKTIDLITHNAITLKNAGNTIIQLNGGFWTLLPGESIQFGQHSGCMITIESITVQFEDLISSPLNFLQIAILKNC